MTTPYTIRSLYGDGPPFQIYHGDKPLSMQAVFDRLNEMATVMEDTRNLLLDMESAIHDENEYGPDMRYAIEDINAVIGEPKP